MVPTPHVLADALEALRRADEAAAGLRAAVVALVAAYAAVAGQPGTWISPAAASKASGLSTRYFYDHADELEFIRRKGRRLLVDREGLGKWLASR